MKDKASEDPNVEVEENDRNVEETLAADNENPETIASVGKRKRKRKRKKKAEGADKSTEKDETDVVEKNMVQHTVYVEGIPFDCSPDQVKEFFVTSGIEDVAELRLPTWQDSGRLRGYGHIVFDSLESYEKALKLSGKHLGKRYLTIQEANAPRSSAPIEQSRDPPPPDCRTIFVNNLPYHASEDDILQVFEAQGVNIAEDGVRIARNSVNRQSKGFCYIDFSSPADAQKIMKSNQRLTVQGRSLRLDWDTGRMKGSYRANSGRLWTKEVSEKKKVKYGR